MGEVFKLNHCYNMDCLPAMELFPDNYFDLAVVDPPYFSGPERRGFYGSKVSKIGVHRDYPVSPAWSKPEPEYFRELFRVCRHYIVWGCNYFDYQFATGRIVWDKCNGNSSFSDCEIAATNLFSSVRMFRYMWSGMMQGKSITEGDTMQGNKSLNEKRIHPTQKPVALYDWIFKNYAEPGQKILDTHLGSGSSRIAAYGLWLYGKIGSAIYSGSSLAAAAAVYNDSLYNDTPNASPSNVSVPISSACLEDGTEVLMDQEQGNVLNEQGVATFIRSGDFVVWGNETCCYPKNTDPKDAFLCVRRFFNHSWTSFVLDNMSKLDKPMNKKRLQSIIDSENMKGSVYVSTEVCASYSMKADPDRNTTAELVAGHYSFYQFCTPFPPFKQINNTMEYEAGALTSALSL